MYEQSGPPPQWPRWGGRRESSGAAARASDNLEPTAPGVGPRRRERSGPASTINRTVNVIERVRKVSIGVVCATVGVLHLSYLRPSRRHVHLVCPQSFPHLWKKLWKIDRIQRSLGFLGRIDASFGGAKVRRPHESRMAAEAQRLGGTKSRPWRRRNPPNAIFCK